MVVKLITTMGLPGSGKTTWAKTQGIQVLDTDALRVGRLIDDPLGTAVFMTQLRDKTRRALTAGQDVLVVACNTTAQLRAGWLNIARECSARPELVVFHVPYDQLMAIQRDRRGSGVPQHKMQRYRREFVRSVQTIRRERWASIEYVRRDDGGDLAVAAVRDVPGDSPPPIDPQPRPARWW